MSLPRCDRSTLVEAMFDGRLGPSEHASTERHLNSCVPCADLLRDLISLQETLRSSSRPVLPLEHQRARLALLRRTAGPSAAKRRPAALLVAVLATLPLAVWASASSVSPLRAWFTVPAPVAQTAPVMSEIAHKPALREPMPASSSAASSTVTGDPSVAAASAASDVPPTLPDQPRTPPPRAARGLVSAPTPSSVGRARDESRGQRATATSSADSSQASQDFAAAMKALSRGDFSASASKLESFVSSHPSDARVEDAVYLQAIAFERAGRLPDAKAAARHYLAAYPDGAHRAQVARIAGD
jgi:hypothetical protein